MQRWERGDAVPDDRVETQLVAFCTERGVFDRAARGAIAVGIASEAELRDVLARARHDRVAGSRPEPRAAEVPFGRVADIDAVRALLTAHTIVTITGPGGVGKTTLARAAAPPGTVEVRLDTIDSADLVLSAIAVRLDVRQYGGRSLRDSVVRAVDGRVPLLVLDNFEHVLAAAPLVADLVLSCADLRVLVTSRAPLLLDHEVEHRLAPLAHDGAASAAVEMFFARAHAADAGLTGDAPELALAQTICARLDGLPLAVELAAARLRHISLRDLAARIDRPPAILGAARNAASERQRTLTGALAWSVDLLDSPARELFRCLAEFADGATLDAVEAVGGPHAIDDVAELLDQHLVARDGGRYRMLQIVRDYAALVVPAPATDPARTFIEWAIELTQSSARRARGREQRTALALLDAEYANLRAALVRTLDQADAGSALPLALALCPYWDARSMLQEARQFLEPAVALAGGTHTASPSLNVWIGYFAAHQGDLPVAARSARDALRRFESDDIAAGIGYARMVLGYVAAEEQRLEDAEAEWTASAAAFEAGGDRWGLVRPLNNLGEVARARGDLDRAERLHAEALTICSELDEEATLPSILNNVAHVALDRGDNEAGAHAAARSLEIATAFENPVAQAFALDVSGRVAFETGEVERAIRLWSAGHLVHERLGLPVEARDRERHDAQLATARHLLGEARFTTLWNEPVTDRQFVQP